MLNNNRGQVAIFVIVALIVVVAIAIVFVFKKSLTLEKQDEFSPQSYMQQCIRQNIDSAIKQMLPQGGFIEPGNHKLYNGSKVEYLCYNHGNFAPCIMQHPVYLTELEGQINSYVGPKVISCYDSLKTELEKRQAIVTYGNLQINSSLVPGKVIMLVNRTATVQRESAEVFDSFNIETRSQIYDLARVAMEIGNQEAQYCYFDYLGYMILYQEVNIDKDVLSDDTKIYSISDRNSGEKLKIAIKGCSIPAGL